MLPESVQTPFMYWKRLFTDQMIEHITEHTNQYSVQQTGTSINTTVAEMEDFLSILLYMGVFEFPSLEDYWACESRFPPVADTMSVKRFKVLRRNFHFNDNFQMEGYTDRFHKIRPLFDMLREQCLLIPPTYKQSVDEVMVAYKGTRAGKLRQYIKNKPDNRGFKIFCCASSIGIIHDFILYQGATTFFNIQKEEHAHLGLEDLSLGAKVVSILCNTITHKEATVVFYDNFFNSFDWVKTLHTNLGLRSVGTVRANRSGNVHSVMLIMLIVNYITTSSHINIPCLNPLRTPWQIETPLTNTFFSLLARLLTEFRTGGGAFLVIQCLCKKKKKLTKILIR
uniref:PiggyBac transposable element-derived protein domain-containing protein n=1 Tax=Cyprinus carpio TaxID=7962 RepID=A0A8C1MEY7_CYPCA